jgi:hypothetical protein
MTVIVHGELYCYVLPLSLRYIPVLGGRYGGPNLQWKMYSEARILSSKHVTGTSPIEKLVACARYGLLRAGAHALELRA